MSTISRWCRACGVENRPDATFCRNCGARFVVLNQRQQISRQQRQNVATQKRDVFGTKGRTIMNWHSPRFRISLVLVFIVLAIGGFGIFWHLTYVDPMAQVTHSYLLKDVPASTASLTTYNDSEYNFMVSYPSDWKANKRDFNGSEYIHFSYQVPTGPDIYPLDIICIQNSPHLTGAQWWDQNGDGTKVSEMPLPDGTEEIVSSAQGQNDYTQYTFVTSQKACKINASAVNSASSNLIVQVAKSFKWQ